MRVSPKEKGERDGEMRVSLKEKERERFLVSESERPCTVKGY